VALDEAAGGRGEPRVPPGPLDGQPLPDGVRRRDAFPPAIARPADAAQHGVDPIPGALGIGQALEHEEAGPLAHHEPVRAVPVGPRAGGRERADLAELHEGRRPHVPVHAADEGDVELMLEEPVVGGVDGRERRRAGRVGGEIGAVQVEEVRDPARHDVGELPGHGVLGDDRQLGDHPVVGLLGDALPGRLVQPGERRGLGEGPGHLREEHPEGALVVLVPPHRRAEDDGGSVPVEGPLGPAVVQQRHSGAGHRPLLGLVHRVGDLRRDRELPPHGVPLEVADPAADLRVGLVRDRRVRVVVERGVPAIRGDVADAVATADDVVPERGEIRGIRQHPGHAHDGEGAVRGSARALFGSGHGLTSTCGRAFGPSAIDVARAVAGVARS